MKKYIFLSGFIMICLLILSIKPSYGLESINNVPININSQDFLSYVKENNIINIKRICVNEYCDNLRGSTIDKAFANFSQKYQTYLKETISEEASLESYLKGFQITKIEILG